MSDVRPIAEIVPTGSMVLIELLTDQELAGTSIYIGNQKIKEGCPQGFVTAVGPGLKPENLANWGFKVGDRVLVTGTFNPCPKIDANQKRDFALMEPHAIKAVLTQQSAILTS